MFPFRIFCRSVSNVPIAFHTRGLAMSSASPQKTQENAKKRSNSEKALDLDETYENAIKILNKLQSNAQRLAWIRQNKDQKRHENMPNTIGALETAGMSLDLLDNLDVIHVAGTKGKGTTCAFTESILRNAGLKTGFFSSPHLVAVRERIRINGKPLSSDSFAKYFFTVYHKMKVLEEPDASFEMPHYFRFLTCMAFHVFLEEEVDAVVLEVGIGGTYDTTNVIRKPIVTGISTLGLEHQNILGNTLEEITMQKAGIMKKGVPVYTVGSHPPHIMELLRSHAKNLECPIHFVQPLDLMNSPVNLGVDDGYVARLNAGLAVHLANEFLLQKHPHLVPSNQQAESAAEMKCSKPEYFLPFHIDGLRTTKWDGRFQVLQVSEQLTVYLDGAHTRDSLEITRKWFEMVAAKSTCRILIFNITGERSSQNLLQPLAESGLFDMAIFCPFIGSATKVTPDNWSALENGKDPTEPCQKHANTWKSMQTKSDGIVCDSAEATMDYIQTFLRQKTTNGVKPSASALVTGSLHLVGTFLSVLQPEVP